MTTCPIRLPLHPALTNAAFKADLHASFEAMVTAMTEATIGSAAAMQELTQVFETTMAAIGELIEAVPEPTLRERLANRFWDSPEPPAPRPQLDAILIPPSDTPAGHMLAWSARRHPTGATA